MDPIQQHLINQAVAYLKGRLPSVGSEVCYKCGSTMVAMNARRLTPYVVAALRKEGIYVAAKDERHWQRVEPPKDNGVK